MGVHGRSAKESDAGLLLVVSFLVRDGCLMDGDSTRQTTPTRQERLLGFINDTEGSQLTVYKENLLEREET